MHGRRFPALAFLLLSAWAVAPLPARADNLDKALFEKATDVLEDQRARGAQNVGVLKFRVQRDSREPSFSDGLLPASLASRLENALILAQDVKKPLGITRDASRVAAADFPKANLLKPEDRLGLFKSKYPLAWGGQKIAVDTFLTGLVTIKSDNLKTISVQIECFDRKAPGLVPVASFTVDTDRSILMDLGESFLLKKSLYVEGTADRDSVALAEQAHKPRADDSVTQAEKLVTLEVLYDERPVPITKDDQGRMHIPEPGGQKVRFRIVNNTTDKLAAVVLVNGVNTLHKERGKEPLDWSRWVLEQPGKKYSISGFYAEDSETVEQFRVVPPEQLSDFDPDKLGQITVVILGPAPKDADATAPKSKKLNLRESGKVAKNPSTLEELRVAVREAATAKGKPKGLLAPGEKKAEKVETTEFGNAVYLGSYTIYYYDK